MTENSTAVSSRAAEPTRDPKAPIKAERIQFTASLELRPCTDEKFDPVTERDHRVEEGFRCRVGGGFRGPSSDPEE